MLIVEIVVKQTNRQPQSQAAAPDAVVRKIYVVPFDGRRAPQTARQRNVTQHKGPLALLPQPDACIGETSIGLTDRAAQSYRSPPYCSSAVKTQQVHKSWLSHMLELRQTAPETCTYRAIHREGTTSLFVGAHLMARRRRTSNLNKENPNNSSSFLPTGYNTGRNQQLQHPSVSSNLNQRPPSQPTASLKRNDQPR